MRSTFVIFHDDSASRFNDEFVVRLFDREKVLVIAKIIEALRHDGGAWHNLQFTLRNAMTRQRTRPETGNVATHRYGYLYLYVVR